MQCFRNGLFPSLNGKLKRHPISALEVSTWGWKCPLSEMLLFYPIMQSLMFCFSHLPLKHRNEQSEVRLWVIVYYINVCFSLLSCLKLWHYEMQRYSQSHIIFFWGGRGERIKKLLCVISASHHSITNVLSILNSFPLYVSVYSLYSYCRRTLFSSEKHKLSATEVFKTSFI